MIYKSMEFEEIKKNEIVMKYGELGTKFFIILWGKVSVRIPSIVEKDFTFRELLETLNENKEWIIENDKYLDVLILIQQVLPDLVKKIDNNKLKLNIDNVEALLKGVPISNDQNINQTEFPKFDFYMRSQSKINI